MIYIRGAYRFLLIALAAVTLSAQESLRRSDNDTLAIVGLSPVTSDQLYRRLSLMPSLLHTQFSDTESLKIRAVESLVGERLLAAMIREDTWTDSWRVQNMRRAAERLFVRDELYRHEIIAKTLVSESAIAQGMKDALTTLTLLGVRCPDESYARRISTQWRRMRTERLSDSAIAVILHLEFDTLKISFGSAEPVLESAAYEVKYSQVISDPLRTDSYGVLVFTVAGKESNPEFAAKSIAALRSNVEHTLRLRKERVAAREFAETLLHESTMSVDTALFRLVTREIWQAVRSDSGAHRVAGGFRIAPQDIRTVQEMTRNERDAEFVRWTGGSLSLGLALEYLHYFDFVFPSLRPPQFAQSMFTLFRTLTETEVIAQEGLNRGLQNTKQVRDDVAEWMTYWRALEAMENIVDTIRTDEAFTDSTPRQSYPAVLAERQESALDKVISELARGNRVEIYYDRIRSAETIPFPMLTRRLIGFGGRINAVPPVLPLWRWADTWRGATPPLP